MKTRRTTLSGFSLVELAVTLAVAAVLVSLAAPNLDGFITNQRVRTAAYDLMGSIQYARSEAVKRRDDATVKPAGSGWADGWIVTDDAAETHANCLANGSDPNCLRLQMALSGVAISGANTISFLPSGRASAAATLTICDSASSAKVDKRVITLSLSGRPNLSLSGKCNE